MRVLGDGPRSARIVIVGEAPGQQEEAQGKPFVGPSGQVLNQMLSSCGIARNEVYVTNVSKTRPPNNDFGAFYEDKSKRVPSQVLKKAIEELELEIRSIDPHIVLAMGSEPLRALTGRMGIDKWRGSLILTGTGHKCLATYHPAFIMRMYHYRIICELDIKKMKKHSSTRTIAPLGYELLIDPTLDVVMQKLDYIHTHKLPVSFDIETVGRHVRCLGFAWNSRRAICIPFTSNKHGPRAGDTTLILDANENPPGSHWREEEEHLVVKECKRILEDKDIPKCAQNAVFDMTVLAEEWGIHTQGLDMDTMLAQHTCYAELGKPAQGDPTKPSASGKKSLDFLCSIWTDTPRYSDYDAYDDLSTWKYNCMDCCVTFEVWRKLHDELKDLEVDEFYYNHVLPTMWATARMQNQGVHIDVKLRQEYTVRCERRLEEIQSEIKEVIGTELNPNSPKQMQEFLYDSLALPKRYHPVTKRLTSNEEAIEWHRDHSPEHGAILGRLLEFRGIQKLVSNTLRVELSPGDTLRTTFNVAGTVNGRLASSATIWGEGTNVQNIPAGRDPEHISYGIRRIVIPPRGYTFIKADLSQAEVRVVAWDAEITTLIERFLNDPTFDIHRWNATNIWKRPETTITKPERDIAKAGVHGGNYGLGAKKASAIYGLSYLDAKHAIEAYRGALPEVEQWWDRIQSLLHATRTLFSPIGRRRQFFGRMDQELFRSAYSFIPQATVSDVINRALCFLHDILKDLGGWPVLQVHDEIDAVVPEHHAEEAMRRMKRVMEYPIRFKGIEEPLVIPVEIGHGPSWGEQEEWNG